MCKHSGNAQRVSATSRAVPSTKKGMGCVRSAQWSLDKEIVLPELGALHLVAHPDRRHAAAGPFEGLVLLAPVFRFGLCALASSAIRHLGKLAVATLAPSA